MATDEPPPYDPEADKVEEDDTATATEQEEKPKKEKVPDEPPPDGEGELGAPMKRVYFIGGSLALWGILAFWLMAYWLASAVDPCRYAARTSTCYTTDYDNCLDEAYAFCEAAYKGSSSSSLTIGTPAPTFGFIIITPSPTAGSGSSSGRDAYNDQYAEDYGADEWWVRMTAWLILTLAIGIGFFGAVASYFAVKKGNPCWNRIAFIMVGIGGAFTAIGGIFLTASWDYDLVDGSDNEDIFNALRATQLGEFLFVGIIGIIFAMDLQQLLLNDEEKRMMAMTIPVAIFSLFLGGCYAYIINWKPDSANACWFDVNTLLYNQMATISAGYFLIGISCVLRILIAKETIKLGDDPARAVLYEFILSLLLLIGGFICAVGYWAVIDKTFDNDTECYNFACDGSDPTCTSSYWYVSILTWLYFDTVQPGILQGSAGDSYDVKYESQFKAFYCGYSFLIIGIVAAIAYDMKLVGNYKKVRAAQSAASD